ncbi:MAG: hypothetical protein IJ150_10590 [Bacteroidales bacterium]|nr:hypothetical protein [Bacteroidales bacterium]
MNNNIKDSTWKKIFRFFVDLIVVALFLCVCPKIDNSVVICIYSVIFFAFFIFYLSKNIAEKRLLFYICFPLFGIFISILYLSWKISVNVNPTYYLKGIGEFVEKKDNCFVYKLLNRKHELEYWKVPVSEDYYNNNTSKFKEYCKYALLKSDPYQIVSFSLSNIDFYRYRNIVSVINHKCDEEIIESESYQSKCVVLANYLKFNEVSVGKGGVRFVPVYFYNSGEKYETILGNNYYEKNEYENLKVNYSSNDSQILIDIHSGEIIKNIVSNNDLKKFKYPVLYSENGKEYGNNSFSYAITEPTNYLKNFGLSSCRLVLKKDNNDFLEIAIHNRLKQTHDTIPLKRKYYDKFGWQCFWFKDTIVTYNELISAIPEAAEYADKFFLD